MADTKEPSELVKTVVALDHHFSDLDRLSAQIQKLDMNTEFGLAQARKLMECFSEASQGVSTEIAHLSTRLNEAREKAESVAKIVADRAHVFQERQAQEQVKLQEFHKLGERVRTLSTAMGEFKRPSGEVLSAEDRARLSMRLGEFQIELAPLIEEAQSLRKDAHINKMKSLEQQADSLTQTLQAVKKKLSTFSDIDPAQYN